MRAVIGVVRHGQTPAHIRLRALKTSRRYANRFRSSSPHDAAGLDATALKILRGTCARRVIAETLHLLRREHGLSVSSPFTMGARSPYRPRPMGRSALLRSPGVCGVVIG
jgi:hypothetical protein